MTPQGQPGVIPLTLELHEFIKKLSGYIKIIRDAGYEFYV